MSKDEFIKYVASFNPDYVTKSTAKDIINQAKKILLDEAEYQAQMEAEEQARIDEAHAMAEAEAKAQWEAGRGRI